MAALSCVFYVVEIFTGDNIFLSETVGEREFYFKSRYTYMYSYTHICSYTHIFNRRLTFLSNLWSHMVKTDLLPSVQLHSILVLVLLGGASLTIPDHNSWNKWY